MSWSRVALRALRSALYRGISMVMSGVEVNVVGELHFVRATIFEGCPLAIVGLRVPANVKNL